MLRSCCIYTLIVVVIITTRLYRPSSWIQPVVIYLEYHCHSPRATDYSHVIRPEHYSGCARSGRRWWNYPPP